jgi:hypothetical protein
LEKLLKDRKCDIPEQVNCGEAILTVVAYNYLSGDEKRAGNDDSDSDTDDAHAAYISSISKKSMIGVLRAGAARILRGGARKKYPPTEMINASNERNGTYKRVDVDQRVVTILNDFALPTKGRARTQKLYNYTDTCDIEHLHGYISFTACIVWKTLSIRPVRKGGNSFWETGYVGERDGLPYYSTKENARRAAAFRVLVDYFAHKVEVMQDPPQNSNWPRAIMDQTTKGDNFVVLAENKGGSKTDDHLFCIVLKHGERYTLLIPREHDYQPWKEVEFGPTNWTRKRGTPV